MNRFITTQIGSLPHDTVEDAIDYSLRHDIPFLPELHARNDTMLEYIKTPGKLSCLKEFKKRKFDKVKVQCVGPATLVTEGYDRSEAIERAYLHIDAILNGLVANEVILFLDEPALGTVTFDFVELWAPIISSFDVVFGVHTCGNMQWDQLFNSDLDIISFDASQFGNIFTIDPSYRNNKRVAWGIKGASDVKDFRPDDLLTLPCGMQRKFYSIEDAERNLNMLREAASQYA